MRIVAILNQKGGVGKTTTAVNLGAALALRGRRVLLIDCDPQCNLTDHLGIDQQALETTVYDILTDEGAIEAATVPTETPGLFVVPSHPDLAAAETELASEIGRELRLRRAIGAIAPDAYDWVLLDCPPSLGLLSLNALAAARELIITVQTEYFALRGLGQLDQIVHMVREHVNPELEVLGILCTLVNPVTRLAREVMDEVRAHYGDLVFQTRIRQNVRLAEAPGFQNHIFAYEPVSAGAQDYAALAVEIEGDTAPSVPIEPHEAKRTATTEAAPAADAKPEPSAQAEPHGGNGQAPADPTPERPPASTRAPSPTASDEDEGAAPADRADGPS